MPFLPAGFAVSLDPGVRRIDDGTVMIGGAPLRVLRLTDAGAALVDRLAAGAPISRGEGAQRLTRRLLDAGMAHPRPASAPYSAADVTVVIPVRDQPLAATLESVGDVANVVVVDDGSRDPVAGATRHAHPLGPAAARNTGWRTATTAVVVFVDAECVLSPGWLDLLLPHFADPLVAAVAPRITTTAGNTTLAAYEAVRSPLDRGPAEGPVRPRGRIPFVPTAVLAIRRSMLEQLGGFDDQMRFGEDVDLVWRLVEAGQVVRYEPSAGATHPPRNSWGRWARQRFDYGSSAAPLGTAHGAAVAPLVVSSWSLGAWLLAALGWPGAGAAVAAGSTAMLVPRLRGLSSPLTEAVRLAGSGHLHAGKQVAEAVRRTWWPLAVVAAMASRRARRAIVAAAIIPPVLEWVEHKPPIDPARWVAVRLADDVAYGAGVWAGCVRARSWVALIPDLSNWPGRKRAVEAA